MAVSPTFPRIVILCLTIVAVDLLFSVAGPALADTKTVTAHRSGGNVFVVYSKRGKFSVKTIGGSVKAGTTIALPLPPKGAREMDVYLHLYFKEVQRPTMRENQINQ